MVDEGFFLFELGIPIMKILYSLILTILLFLTTNSLSFADELKIKKDLQYLYQKDLILPTIKGLPDKTEADILCMAMTMYYEARGTIKSNIIGVGYVTMNRLSDGSYGSSVCNVVYQKIRGYPQFTWTALPNKKPKETQEMLRIQKYAYSIYFKQITDPTNGATHFYLIGVDNPKWKNKGPKVKLGPHMFVKL